MKQAASFVISEFTNPSGEIVCRVTGWLDGKRVRKNFSTWAEAQAERQALEVRVLQSQTGVRSAITRLTDDELHEAETAIWRLRGAPRTLSFYVDYGLAHFREPNQQKPFVEAVAEYLAIKTKEQERTLLSFRQLRSIRYELAVLQVHYPSGPVSQFDPTVLTAYLERGGPSLKTYNNRRGLLSTFFKFALQREWIASNPVAKTVQHRIAHRRGSAVTLSAQQSAQLMEYVEGYRGGKMVPFFALCLFAGIRPCLFSGEILKLKAEDVRLDLGVIRIEPDVSKVRMQRQITIQPNLAAWLCAYPLERFPIVPMNAKNMRRAMVEKFGLTHDVLRHTFISMHVAKFRSIGEAALQAGNSESIIRNHYLNLKTPAEAEEFFSILPKRQVRAATEAAAIGSSGPTKSAA